MPSELEAPIEPAPAEPKAAGLRAKRKRKPARVLGVVDYDCSWSDLESASSDDQEAFNNRAAFRAWNRDRRPNLPWSWVVGSGWQV